MSESANAGGGTSPSLGASSPSQAPSDPRNPQSTNPAVNDDFEEWDHGGKKIRVPRSELRNGYMRGADSTKKWQEASNIRKEADTQQARVKDFIDSVGKSPRAALRQLLGDGTDIGDVLASALEEELAEQSKSPHQREMENLRKERDDLKGKFKSQEDRQQQVRDAREAQAFAAQYEKDLTEFVDRNPNITPLALHQAMAMQKLHADQDNELSIDEAYDAVKEETEALEQNWTAGLAKRPFATWPHELQQAAMRGMRESVRTPTPRPVSAPRMQQNESAQAPRVGTVSEGFEALSKRFGL